MEPIATLIKDAVAHPFSTYEREIVDYVPNTLSSLALVSCFGAGCVAMFASTHAIIQKCRPSLSTCDRFLMMWFVMCGFIHFFFEGYFAYNFEHMPSRTDLFGQLWKEYSLSDSRYQTKDSFVTCMEAITAVAWGPLSFAIAYFILVDHPLRHPISIIVSLGQFYGDVLYYATCFFNEKVYNEVYCRPEAFYFYAYYVLMNAFWIVIPGFIMIQSVCATAQAFKHQQQTTKSKKKA